MLCWNVYCSNFNSGEIKVFNIFNHWSFYEACLKAKKKFKDDREGFEKEVRSWLTYFFWSKCEYEIILDHWPDGEWSELRKTMTVSEMCDMFKSAGLECDSWHINEKIMDKDVDLKVYPGWNRFRKEKIDVYEQVMNNWDIFIDYLWNNRKELKARE